MKKHISFLEIMSRDGTGDVLSDHFNEDDAYCIKRPSGMQNWLVTFTLEGTGYFIIEGEEVLVKAGDIAIIREGIPHQYGTRKGQVWNFVWAQFVPNIQESKWMQLPESPKGFFFQSIDNDRLQKRIYRAFKRVIHDNRQAGPHSNDLCINALHEVLLLISQNISKPLDPRVAEALHLLSEQMRGPIRIENLAKSIGLSSSRLAHLFKSETGHSIVATLIQMRLRQASLLLKHTARSAAEVAWDVGFQDYNHFANRFKAYYGMNPLQYRKDVRQK